MYTFTTEYIICGDINIDYLVDCERKSQLEALLETYNLTSVVNLLSHAQKNSATPIDNTFIDFSKMGNYSICPIINGLSDHDVQSITLHSFNMRSHTQKSMLLRKTKESKINDFLMTLSYETWDNIFSTDDVNKMFNSFLDCYLKFLYSYFPLKGFHFVKKKIP